MKRHREWGAYAGPGDSWEGYPSHPKDTCSVFTSLTFWFFMLALLLFGLLIAQDFKNDKRKAEIKVAEKKSKEVQTDCETVFVFDGYGNSFKRLECQKPDQKKK